MDTVTITIRNTGSAFDDDAGHEIARILRDLAARIADGERPSTLRDYFGNRCGEVSFADFDGEA